ncbi:MAG: hypothetical protein ACLQIB_20960 [Isosphaeraceae bacterium]
MKFSSASRPTLSFRPHLEQSEPRLLLSAGGLVHAEMSRSAVPLVVVPRGFAGYIKTNNQTIFSIVVRNKTNDSIDVTASSAREPDLSGNKSNLSRGGTVPVDGGILLYTNDRAGEFTLDIKGSNLTIKKTFDVEDSGKETPISGYKFGTAADIDVWWKFDASVDRSAQFQVVIKTVDKTRMLVVEPVPSMRV